LAKLKEKAEAVLKSETSSNIDLSKIDIALLNIKKEIGDDVIIDIEKVKAIPRVPCRSPKLGYVFGNGGTPEGKIIEIYGPESSGKSLLAQNIVADYQRVGKFGAYVDMEYSFDPKYASIQGLDLSPEKFKLLQPDTGEDAFTVIEKLAETGQVGIIVMDSVAAMIPKAELEGEMTDAQMGAQARMMGKGLRKITAICAKNNCTIIFINQIRMKIGVMFGSPETTPGGNALKFFASIRCEVRKGDKTEGETDNEDTVGIVAKVKNVKNKTSVPFRKCELFFSFTDGIDVYGEYVDFGVSMNVIQKAGAWYSMDGEKIGQGRANTIIFFKGNKDYFEKIKSKVDAQLAGNPLIDVKLPETAVEETSIASLAQQAGN